MNGSSASAPGRCRSPCRRNRRRRPSSSSIAFFADLERELEKVEFFRPHEKRGTMSVNLRNIFTRMQPTQQDIRTLHGVIMAIAQGRKGPARGGVLDGRRGDRLRDLLAEHGRLSPASGRRCAGWRGCCGAIRPRPSARCGRRWSTTGASPAAASSGRCRSGRISPISCRFRSDA